MRLALAQRDCRRWPFFSCENFPVPCARWSRFGCAQAGRSKSCEAAKKVSHACVVFARQVLGDRGLGRSTGNTQSGLAGVALAPAGIAIAIPVPRMGTPEGRDWDNLSTVSSGRSTGLATAYEPSMLPAICWGFERWELHLTGAEGRDSVSREQPLGTVTPKQSDCLAVRLDFDHHRREGFGSKVIAEPEALLPAFQGLRVREQLLVQKDEHEARIQTT